MENGQPLPQLLEKMRLTKETWWLRAAYRPTKRPLLSNYAKPAKKPKTLVDRVICLAANIYDLFLSELVIHGSCTYLTEILNCTHLFFIRNHITTAQQRLLLATEKIMTAKETVSALSFEDLN